MKNINDLLKGTRLSFNDIKEDLSFLDNEINTLKIEKEKVDKTN